MRLCSRASSEDRGVDQHLPEGQASRCIPPSARSGDWACVHHRHREDCFTGWAESAKAKAARGLGSSALPSAYSLSAHISIGEGCGRHLAWGR
jgi:hypothetical protein